jgi:polyisoprenoid-binding protein YceI
MESSMARRVPPTVAILLLALAALAAAETWTIGPGSEVVFESKAPLESFEGTTDQVRGHITCTPDALVGPVDLRIEVDLASLDTGIGLRNNHMRDRHLETDEFPHAVFTGEAVTRATSALVAGQTVELDVRGQFALHGVVRPRELTATAILAGDGTLTVDVEFPVSLEDHAIERPGFLVMKLADEQTVRVHLVARPEAM